MKKYCLLFIMYAFWVKCGNNSIKENKHGILLLRIKTNESEGEEKLRAKLDEIIRVS